MTEKLKPCPNPYCESDPHIVVETKAILNGHTLDTIYYVECQKCKYSCYKQEHPDFAIKEWNKGTAS